MVYIYIQYKNANFNGLSPVKIHFIVQMNSKCRLLVLGSKKKKNNYNFFAKNEIEEMKFLESMENINKIWKRDNCIGLCTHDTNVKFSNTYRYDTNSTLKKNWKTILLYTSVVAANKFNSTTFISSIRLAHFKGFLLFEYRVYFVECLLLKGNLIWL